MQNGIPLYSFDGGLLDWISESRMNRLDRLGLIKIVRHKKGHVARCILHRRPGDPKPVRVEDYLGTRYSFREHLDNGFLCWQLRRLGRADELRPIFLAVVTECMAAP
jgi:hypothetical protein